MRWKTMIRILAAVAALCVVGTLPAAAADLLYTKREGCCRERVVTHHVYYPHYTHIHHVEAYVDPYAYRPATRGYYPYYNSGYWKSLHEMRSRPKPHYVLPAYYPAWGYAKKKYRHKEWHYANHGHHFPWHW